MAPDLPAGLKSGSETGRCALGIWWNIVCSSWSIVIEWFTCFSPIIYRNVLLQWCSCHSTQRADNMHSYVRCPSVCKTLCLHVKAKVCGFLRLFLPVCVSAVNAMQFSGVLETTSMSNAATVSWVLSFFISTDNIAAFPMQIFEMPIFEKWRARRADDSHKSCSCRDLKVMHCCLYLW